MIDSPQSHVIRWNTPSSLTMKLISVSDVQNPHTNPMQGIDALLLTTSDLLYSRGRAA